MTRKFGSLAAIVAMLMTLFSFTASSVTAATINTGFTLEGCNLDHGATFIEATITCTEDGYTTGNLGKSWAELDLVPMRMTLDNGSNATVSGSVIVAGDYKNGAGTKTGWDLIGSNAADLGPVLDTAHSDAACQAVTWGAVTITPPGGGVGGADQTIYRVVSGSVPAHTTCIYNYWMRLSLGAHLFSGSSLQANLWDENLSSAGVGQKRIQLPVAELLPPTVSKTMTASATANDIWTLQKSASPTVLHFGDVCAANAPTSLPVDITVAWTKTAGTAGAITVVTDIYGTNNAHRALTLTAIDTLKSGTTTISTTTGSPTVVPALTQNVLLAHIVQTVPAGTTNLNDSAVATVTDTLTGIPIPGFAFNHFENGVGIPATATATPTVTETNSTATITDSESMTGNALSFNAAIQAVATGAFTGGYVAGTDTTGPVGWSSGVQNASGDEIFNKNVKLAGQVITTGVLTDTATLTTSGGVTASASLEVNIDSTASTTLTINKTIPNVLQGSETASFSFVVSSVNGSQTVTIPFSAGQTTQSAVVPGLAFGVNYTVTEVVPAGWIVTSANPVQTGVTGCAASVSFGDIPVPANVDVTKVTVPAGNEAGWVFTLTGPGVPAGTTATTTGSGAINFGVSLGEGTYTITETPKTGYDQTGSSGCTFTVDFPADAGRTFHCTFTNTARGTIIVRKETNPDGALKVFDYTVAGGLADFALADGQNSAQTNLTPGNYAVSEDLPNVGWNFTSLTCTSTGAGTSASVVAASAAMVLGPGGVIDCTYVNTQRAVADVTKTVSGAAIPAGLTVLFQVRTGASVASQGTVAVTANLTSATSFPYNFFGPGAFVDPGEYQICEFILPGWNSTLIGMPGAFLPGIGAVVPGGTYDNSFVCIPVTLTAGQTYSLTVDNTPPPGGMAKTIGFWKNWASCASSQGKQKPILDQTLAKAGSYLVGDEVVDTCQEAVNLLNKSDLSGKKQASAPEFNFASQYMAYLLNITAGAADTTAAHNAAVAGQLILDAHGFIGNAFSKNELSATEKANLNTYAGILDNYNNDIP